MNSADGSTTTPGQGVPKIADYICPSDQKVS